MGYNIIYVFFNELNISIKMMMMDINIILIMLSNLKDGLIYVIGVVGFIRKGIGEYYYVVVICKFLNNVVIYVF